METITSTAAPARLWGVSFALHSAPNIEAHKQQFIEATHEAEARATAWHRAEAQGITTASHLVRKVYRHRGMGFAAGHGVQRQDMSGAPRTSGPVAAPAPQVAGSLDGMVAAIASEAARQAVTAMEAKVNPDMVRELVAEAMAADTRPIRDLRITTEDGKPPVVIRGAHPLLEKVLRMVRTPKPDGTRVNVEMVGPAGCGKTHLARNVAEALGLPFLSTSFSAGVDESELVGSLFPTMDGEKYVESAFVKIYRSGGVWLGDEWDGADANVRLRLNQATANGHMTLADKSEVKRHPDCIILTASNTWGHGGDRAYCGRQAQDESSNDRFVQVAMDYDEAVETDLVFGHVKAQDAENLLTEWRRIRRAARASKIPKPVSMRKVIDMAHMLHCGVYGTVAEAVREATAGWSVAERAAVSL